MKKHAYTLFLLLIFCAGLSLMLYPLFSRWRNTACQSQAIRDYHAALLDAGPEACFRWFAAAEEYNREMAKTDDPLTHYGEIPGYEAALDVTGTGMMAYISIEKIGVILPVYHGTSESVLQRGVGHLEGSSLPTGGEGTHCVLSAHSGLPSDRLFSDLEKLEIGDIFTLTVLDRVLIYEIDRILTVEPQCIDPLYVVKGEDLCTLVTCTPHGINTHRLLVRGTRIESREEDGSLCMERNGKWTGNGEYADSGGEANVSRCMADAEYTAVFSAAVHGELPQAPDGGGREALSRPGCPGRPGCPEYPH